MKKMNWKECRRKRSRHNLRYYPRLFLEGLRLHRNEAEVLISQTDIWSSGCNTVLNIVCLALENRLLKGEAMNKLNMF
jgi:ribosomal protein L30/L7E